MTLRRLPTPKGQRLVAESAKVHRLILAAERKVGDLKERRRQLWLEANAEGVTQESISDECLVSLQLVGAQIARARGAAWARVSGG